MTSSWNAIGWLIFALIVSAITVVGWISGGLLAIWAWMGMNTLMVDAGLPNWMVALLPILVISSVGLLIIRSKLDY